MKKLDQDFYLRKEVLQIAKELLGKVLVTCWEGVETSGRIVELEAYRGVKDKASHAYGGRRTERNESMYAAGGRAYIYLCYGIHHLVNVVTHQAGTPHAILIRALEPLSGIPVMLQRTGKSSGDPSLTRGPGNLSKAMGLQVAHDGFDLGSQEFYIASDGWTLPSSRISRSPRIGVDYAGEDALLPYRFYIKGNPWVSGKPK